jgi:fibronectin-binding autotransporter adhesin
LLIVASPAATTGYDDFSGSAVKIQAKAERLLHSGILFSFPGTFSSSYGWQQMVAPMKKTVRNYQKALAILGFLGVIFAQQIASAATYTWSGATTGTWNTTNTNWSGAPTDPWDITNGGSNAAIFDTASLNAPVSGTVYTNGITFSTTGSLRSGGTINLAGTSPFISTPNGQAGTIGSTITGTSGFTKSGDGTLILAPLANSTQSGDIIVNSGTLALGGSANINHLGTGTVTINSGATLYSYKQNSLGGNVPGSSPVTLNVNGGTVLSTIFIQFRSLVMTGGTMDVTGGGWVSGDNVTIHASSTGSFITGNFPFFLRVDPTGTVGGTKTFDVARGSASSDLTISSYLVNPENDASPVAGILKTGSGIMTLTNANTYTGATTVSAGTLQIGDGGTTGSLSTSSAITNNGTLAFNRSNAVTQGTHFSGAAISGTGSLVQAGSGTLTLSAANTYSGNTTISTGALALGSAGSIASSGTISVAAGAALDVSAVSGGFTLGSSQILKGSGTVVGNVTINGGLQPGNSPGTLSMDGNLVLGATSLSVLEIDGITSGLYDVVQQAGGNRSVTFDGTLSLVFADGWSTPTTLTLFDFNSYQGQFSQVQVTGLAEGYTAEFLPGTGQVVVAVPEPGAIALAGIGVAMAGWAIWNRRRTAGKLGDSRRA